MPAAIGIQPSEASRIVDLAKTIIPQNSEMSSGSGKLSLSSDGEVQKLAENHVYVPAEDTIKSNLSAVESHKKELNNPYKVDGIWERLTSYCQKNNEFLLIFEEFRDIIRADPMESSFKK